jgi:hypothetical protein
LGSKRHFKLTRPLLQGILRAFWQSKDKKHWKKPDNRWLVKKTQKNEKFWKKHLQNSPQPL